MLNCIKCHFLKYDKLLIDKKNRNINSITGILNKHTAIGCHKKVWWLPIDKVSLNDSKVVKMGEKPKLTIKIKNETKIIEELNRNRKSECFFFEFKEYMQFEAAEELQKRETENFALKKSLNRSTIGLFIAGIGLVVSAIFNIISLFSNNIPPP